MNSMMPHDNAAESSSRRRARRGSHLVYAAALTALAMAGCVENTKGSATPHTSLTPEEAAKRFEKMMARENGPFEKHELALLDGLAAGTVEAKVKPKPECQKDKSDDMSCGFNIELGNDEEGDADSILCEVNAGLHAFGPSLKTVLNGAQLTETPQLGVKAMGEGLVIGFTANTTAVEQNVTRIGTTKVSALFAHGYVATCWDVMAGGRKTFERIVGQFFQSLKFKNNPKQPTLFAIGYQRRKGDQTLGIRYDYIEKRGDGEPGFNEMSTYFGLETDGKEWSVHDYGMHVARDEAGEIEALRTLYWLDGKGPLVLTAKPSEDKRFRLKLEVGEKTNSLEATPKAPLNTELWAAPALLKVSSGGVPSYRYAVLGMDDTDPSFRYVALTRSQPGVLLEQVEAAPTGKKKKGTSASAPDAGSTDELHVDARGIVTKEVSSDSVAELITTWGDLPSVLTGKKEKTPSKAGGAARPVTKTH